MTGGDLPSVRPTWSGRPQEEAALFNPAFLVELTVRAVFEWERVLASPLPLALAFVIPPVVLHPGLRDALPRRVDAAFGTWTVTHQHLLIHVPRRVVSLKPVMREALIFGGQIRALAFEAPGLRLGSRRLVLASGLAASTQEADEIRRCASLLGRWLATQPRSAAVLQAFGVKP